MIYFCNCCFQQLTAFPLNKTNLKTFDFTRTKVRNM